MNMHVIVFPFNAAKTVDGKYMNVDYLYFYKEQDARKALSEQAFPDGHELYEVPLVHKGALVRHNKVLWTWTKEHFVEAEDYAIEHKLKLIEFDRSWIE